MHLYDVDEKQTSKAVAGVRESLLELEGKGLLRGPIKSAKEAHELVHGCNDLAKALEGAIYVQVGSKVIIIICSLLVCRFVCSFSY